ncbi:nucleotidyltransferase family protein [Candidatus Omnitrophota bacterium]
MLQKKQRQILHKVIAQFVHWCIVHSCDNDRLSQETLPEPLLNTIITILSYHGLIPLAYNYFKESNLKVSDEFQAQLNASKNLSIGRNLFWEDQYLKLVKITNNNGISILPLKGMHFLLASDATTWDRPMCDVDILVHPDEYTRCETALVKNGFKLSRRDENERDYWCMHQMHLAFVKQLPGNKKRFFLEVHWALDYPRSYPVLPKLWNRIRRTTYNHHEIDIMSHEDMLFTIALHQRRFGGLLQLKYVVDVGTLFVRYGEALDYNYLINEAQRSKLRSALYALLQQTSRYYSSQKLTTLMKKGYRA